MSHFGGVVKHQIELGMSESRHSRAAKEPGLVSSKWLPSAHPVPTCPKKSPELCRHDKDDAELYTSCQQPVTVDLLGHNNSSAVTLSRLICVTNRSDLSQDGQNEIQTELWEKEVIS